MKKIAVIGAGSWGTAIANLLANKGYEVTLWGRDVLVVDAINTTKHHPKYLTDVVINPAVNATCDLEAAADGADVVVMATPSHVTRETLSRLSDGIRGETVVVSLAKGIEEHSLKRMSQVMREVLRPEMRNRVAILSGPNHAEEVSRSIPSATVISSPSQSIANQLQDIFMTPYFRVYTNPDLTGVEMGGAVKNVIAIAAGISDGLGFGDNTKASLLTRGLAEMIRLGTAMGADARTFAGLAGIGDLVVTCMSQHSRNRRVGEMLGKGMNLTRIYAEMNMVAEGIRTASAVAKLAEEYRIDMPITENVRNVLYLDKNALECVSELMSRGAVEEMQGVEWEAD
ncbi:MAG: NAD(P)H-dependent glycerol-3-phosphate dehydrogenase [Actinomycetota bacterium]|nr:NAD(P)H-dependent glycerol-3-phosphate dehydrogenase [Actinomycetota bacterium]